MRSKSPMGSVPCPVEWDTNMSVLVTGGNGFLGSEICRMLVARGIDVISLQRSTVPEPARLPGVEYLSGDVSNRSSVDDAMDGVDTVFHVAAKAGMWGKSADYERINVDGTRNVVNACLMHGVKRMVYTSTPSVVFNGEPICGWDERTPYGQNWLCDYARSKCEAEQIALDPAHRGQLPVVALRPHLIWGVGDPNLIPRLVARAQAGRMIRVGDGTNRVDITHVANAAHAHLCAYDVLMRDPEKVSGKAYFISDGNPVILWDWIQGLFDRLGLPEVKRSLPLGLVYRMAGVAEWVYRSLNLSAEPPMTRWVAVELAKDHFFDISAARNELGYEPVVGMEEGLRTLVASMQPNTNRTIGGH